MKFNRIALVIVAASATLFSAVTADAQAKPEDLLKMRQGLKQAVKTQFAPIGAFAKGETALPTDALARAENMIALGKILPSAWASGSENIPNSGTKPEAFTDPEFATYWQNYSMASVALRDAIASGDEAAIKGAVGGVGKTCKACHDEFSK